MTHFIANCILLRLALGNSAIEVDWLYKPVVLTYQLLISSECEIEVANKLWNALGYF